jgi:hypothetical protein
MMSENNAESNYSKYGEYVITENLELILPETIVKIERIGEHAFSYYRQDSEGKIVEKMIPSKSNELKIELAPIRPLNHPARRTSHIFLKFDKEIYLSKNSAASIFVHCPIEIGIFLVNNSEKESLDWITCNPLNSRFGLYGSPDTGTLCKFAEVTLASDYSDSSPYVDGVMKVVIENNLDSGKTVSKVVFPITDNSLYYENYKSIIDGVKVTLKKRAVVNVADIQADPAKTNWTQSPTWESSTSKTSMEMGLE